jgi:6-pyruvoyltetrahydropterin/6-carboxytetrahydropterin synthase
MRAELSHAFHFEAAHRLPHVAADHPCARMHGHSYTVVVSLEGPFDPQSGWVLDFGELAAIAAVPIAELDHRLLNDIPGLENPTSEVLAAWLWDRLAPDVPGLMNIEVRETTDTSCTFRGS